MRDKRTRLIDQAIELFISHGIISVTMDEVANAAGMSKKTVYQSFASKTILVESVIDSLIMRSKAILRSNIEVSDDPVQELILQQGLFKYLINVKNLFNEMMLKRYPRALREINEFKNNYLKAVIELNLFNGIAKGLYRPELNIKETSSIYISMTDFYLFHHLKNRDEVFAALQLFINGIITKDGKHVYENCNIEGSVTNFNIS